MASTLNSLTATSSATPLHSQFALETIVRNRIFETLYWKEECFGLNAETLVDKAVELDHVGGLRGNSMPSRFLCLVMKMLQLSPSLEIVKAFVENHDFKYLAMLGAFYLRLVGRPEDIFTVLEPLILDFRRLRLVGSRGECLTYIDEFVDQLLSKERVCDVLLPRLPPRRKLLDSVGLRISPLQEEFENLLIQKELLEEQKNAQIQSTPPASPKAEGSLQRPRSHSKSDDKIIETKKCTDELRRRSHHAENSEEESSDERHRRRGRNERNDQDSRDSRDSRHDRDDRHERRDRNERHGRDNRDNRDNRDDRHDRHERHDRRDRDERRSRDNRDDRHERRDRDARHERRERKDRR